MMIQNKQYVELRGGDPLDAVIAGRHYKAYLVANLAINQGAEASVEQYGLSLSEVHGAIAFYYENKASIEQSIEDAKALSGHEISLQERLEQIKKRSQE